MARLIEGEIIPRLLLAHRNDAATPLRPLTVPATISRADAETIAGMTLMVEVFELVAYAERFLERGVSIDSIYLDLLAPAARTLGSWWDNDMCDFVDVTMGLWRLQQVVHEMVVRASCPSVRTRADRRVLFTVPPGDQHSFGLVMIEEFFRRAGWRTWSAPDAGLAALKAIVGRQWFELIGLTVSNVEHVANMPDLIRALRGASQNPAVGVMVGGQIFSENPALADGSGADATAADGASALVAAERLVEQLGRRI
ncbi:cobalamin B12-binding domain-containing protein (plasmid) [Polymorphobacter sp. PAMC 29334]|uniref:cobalamin B12-binding domain-containing protein n=1 Tax=Polymorphobacter sp. PAMC 29334 TaxID=2862331 RepID=UPI001C6698A7|nr:cobalamin B12-binding domain-containing protein [Polymorphobacter sp. PAMC 29334]QYE33378.1 cobalamin B12-binding domain-containing protein [Polymorphobacter sp. PAMC 29334]